MKPLVADHCLITDFKKTVHAVCQGFSSVVKYIQSISWSFPLLITVVRPPGTQAALSMGGFILRQMFFTGYQGEILFRKTGEVMRTGTPVRYMTQMKLRNHCGVNTSQQLALKLHPSQSNKYFPTD